MGDQQYLLLTEGAKKLDKGLRQRIGNLSTFSGQKRKVEMKKEMIRKGGAGSPRRKEKRVSRRKTKPTTSNIIGKSNR